MATFECPACGREHSDNDNPDMLTDLGPSNRTSFECDCGAEFDLHVDFEPIFYVLKDTLKRNNPGG